MPKKKSSASKDAKEKSNKNSEKESDKNEDFEILVPPDHLTRFERSRIIGAIALQISMGAPILIEVEEESYIDPIEVAELELRAGILPLTIRRTTPSGFFQDIPLSVLLENPLSFR
ncbi:MAG: DNA-directed RNA polymerase subunit K [Candidatus Lokiarchaeota archaeon]|nr:DNA-directed RNA polymerase subunit K [Candidatus Lokiarchaeota archaeon]